MVDIMEQNDYYIKVLFSHDAFDESALESAWVKIVEDRYVLDNVLFYATEYALGDVISVSKINDEWYATGLIEESGHSTIRLLFYDLDTRDKTRAYFQNKGCRSEISNIDLLIALDLPSNISYRKIKNYLEKGEEDRKWEYQEAAISTLHSQELI